MKRNTDRSHRDVRDHRRIRKVTELVYLYGFFSRDELKDFKINKNTYDKELRRLKEIYEEHLVTGRESGCRAGFRRNYFSASPNRLVETFYLKSYTDKEVVILLHSLIFMYHKESIRVGDIVVLLETKGVFTEESDIYSTVRRVLDELSEDGILEKSKGIYRLTENVFQEMSPAQLLQLYRYVCFAMRTTYPKVAGYYLKNSLEQRLDQVGLSAKDNLFFIRHTNERNVLDEELVYQILDSIHKRTRVQITRYDDEQKALINVSPVYLKGDRKLGRWFLLGTDEKGPQIIRLGYIERVTMTSKPFDYEVEKAKVDKWFGHSILSSRIMDDSPFEVRVKLNFGENEKLREQFKREKLIGELIAQDGGEMYLSRINDPVELLPWLRSWSKVVEILPGSDGLREMLVGEIREMIAVYENL